MPAKLIITVALLAALATPAEAAGGSDRREVFAIIVANNHSSALGRPDLRYADDDGAKYYEVFTLLAPPANVHLLSELDRDTAGLFSQLRPVARPPTRDALFAAAADVAKRARVARAAGKSVEVYFVFAGHGDVDRGAGFLELADGALTADQLEHHVLAGIPATHTHVILDSCNSFFVINARKPGGRRFATPTDVAEVFAKKLPHVGVFLSTSAEQEVYEWSELQSGIFSHAVRSGVLGAADVDGDGAVTYRELQAFVTVSAAKVKNPLYRPNVFARGPAGRNDVALVDLQRVDALRVSVGPDQTRLTVRDREALPWIDAHVERGAKIELRIPRRAADGGSIEQLGSGDKQVTARWALPAATIASEGDTVGATTVAMTSLSSADPTATARGPQTMLRMLFAEPFGPGAYSRIAQYQPPEQVFGVSQDDAQRMDLLLGAVADQQRGQRLRGGIVSLAVGGLFTGGYAYLRSELRDDALSGRDYAMLGFGGGVMLLGTYLLASRSEGEKIYASYRGQMARRRGEEAVIAAETERRLAELAERSARMRRYMEYSGWGYMGVGLVAWGTLELAMRYRGTPGEDRAFARVAGGGLALTGAVIVGMSRLMRSPDERLYGLWRDDPSLRRIPRLGIAPASGGGMLTLGGAF